MHFNVELIEWANSGEVRVYGPDKKFLFEIPSDSIDRFRALYPHSAFQDLRQAPPPEKKFKFPEGPKEPPVSFLVTETLSDHRLPEGLLPKGAAQRGLRILVLNQNPPRFNGVATLLVSTAGKWKMSITPLEVKGTSVLIKEGDASGQVWSLLDPERGLWVQRSTQ